MVTSSPRTREMAKPVRLLAPMTAKSAEIVAKAALFDLETGLNQVLLITDKVLCKNYN